MKRTYELGAKYEKLHEIYGRKQIWREMILPNCSTCPIFSECPVYAIGDRKGDPEEDCPFLKLLKSQK